MKKRLNIVLSVIFVAFLCLTVLSACSGSGQKSDFFGYSEENLNWVGKLVYAMHRWIGNYGWTVVVFTLFLKLVMLPLDIWQRTSMRKMTIKTQKMQPLIAEIDRRYGANTQRANEEKQKLYKKEGYSMFSSCLPMVVSMVVFFVMFSGLRSYSTYSSVTNFRQLSGTYFDTYYQAVKDDSEENFAILKEEIVSLLSSDENGEVDPDENYVLNHYTEETVTAYSTGIEEFLSKVASDTTERNSLNKKYQEIALAKVATYYEENHESWLWLQNVWQPDTWAAIMPAYDDSNNGFGNSFDMDAFYGGDGGESHYKLIREAVLSTGTRGENGKWNGLMILPILSVALSFLSIFISQNLEKKKKAPAEEPKSEQQVQQAATNKMMMFLMPAMMAVFGFMYTGAFAIYMVANYTLSIVSTIALRVPCEKLAERSIAKQNAKNDKKDKADYMR